MGGFGNQALSVFDVTNSRKIAREQNKMEAENVRTGIQRIQQAQQKTEELNRADLRKELATQRARFGAQGIVSTDGSSKAVLDGLRKQTEEAINDNRAASNRQVDDIGRKISNSRRLNLLQESYDKPRRMYGLFRQSIRNIPLIGNF
ncbi:MAG: hypothetical protein A3G18_10380 [Rhodospirillales bacterium RIFCSPLOWO2_12_FULL_58_28]|nr:MAG: hypothetical protein A3H92_08555 [Rhodospirillales bacterium RIFCSPLOWO2_02_FULL_58_16]OHC77682.1 MAG: hypothetical protein A3G18_10380 [Rhodospirillales bacterium RIFCSPLOWO2_12_FULL_58_28]